MSSGQLLREKVQKEDTARVPHAHTANLPRKDGAPERGSTTSPMAILALQRRYGNRAAQRIIRARLHSGGSADPYEREADRAAQQATSQAVADNVPYAQTADAQVQPAVRRDGTTYAADDEFERHLAASRAAGKSIPKTDRARFEARFGADFSKVRIHADHSADDLSRSIQAKAFTHGNDIYFASGQYNTSTPRGNQLMAHELTHTLQQTGTAQHEGGRTPGVAVQRAADDDQAKAPEQPEEHAASGDRPNADIQKEINQAMIKLPIPDDRALPEDSEVLQGMKEGRELGDDLRGARSKSTVASSLVDAVGGDPAERKPVQKKHAADPHIWARIKAWFAQAMQAGGADAPKFAKLEMLGEEMTELRTGASVAASVSSVVAFFFQAISAALDIDAIIGPKQKFTDLDEVAKEAKQMGGDPVLVEAVKGAMKLKYRKFVDRMAKVATTLLGLGVTAALLGAGATALSAGTPVGWAIGGALALTGTSFAIYKLWRNFKKGEDRGRRRKQIAQRLFRNAMQGDSKSKGAAQTALKALGLPVQRWMAEWAGAKKTERAAQEAHNVADIMRKLKAG